MIFRKEVPKQEGYYFVKNRYGIKKAFIVYLNRDVQNGATTSWAAGRDFDMTDMIGGWGDRIATSSVEIEEDEP